VEPRSDAPPRRWLRRVGLTVAVGYLATFATNRSLVVVRGPSMEPTLWPGDRLLTVPAHRWWLRPGQVVVVAVPGAPGRLVVKRLHAVGHGTAEVRGDAPDRSTDSRQWGPLPVLAVRRIAVARWPDLRTPLRRRVG
jgi:nickel-type superoxide dismutase maturation protease